MRRLFSRDRMLSATYYLIGCVTAFLFKLVPHLPNFSPELVFSFYMVTRVSRRHALFGVFGMWLVCDVGYGLLHSVPAFGSWSLFSYSYLFALIFFAWAVPVQEKRFGLFAMLNTFIFWTWTNFGVWLFSGMYSYTFTGIVSCYAMALPFLAYSLLSSFFWVMVLFLLLAQLSRQSVVQHKALMMQRID